MRVSDVRTGGLSSCGLSKRALCDYRTRSSPSCLNDCSAPAKDGAIFGAIPGVRSAALDQSSPFNGMATAITSPILLDNSG